MNNLDKTMDIKVTLEVTIPNAVSLRDLVKHYRNDAALCARALLNTGGLTGATGGRFTVVSATLVARKGGQP